MKASSFEFRIRTKTHDAFSGNKTREVRNLQLSKSIRQPTQLCIMVVVSST